MKAHWESWGYQISQRLQSRLLPETAFVTALKAQSQAQIIARQLAEDANIYLEGSIVTTGLMEKGSDLDLSCIVNSVGSVPAAKVASKYSEKLYHRIKYSIPSTCRIQHIDMVRIPLVKYDAMSSVQVENSIITPLSPERERNARTGSFNFDFPLSKEKARQLLDLMSKTGSTVEESALTENPTGTGSTFTFRAKSTDEILRCLGVLPDGKSGIISKATKNLYSRSFANSEDLPELLRFSFDITFLGYAVRNSYLIRKYLHDPQGPTVSRLCQLAIKRWGKFTEFGVGAKGNLTSYGMTILWIYYLLRTGQLGWYDPWFIPDAIALPRYPDYTPWPDRIAYEELGSQLFEFFRFYSTFDWKNEVISLSRTRASTRDDVKWHDRKRERFHYVMCIEDPYEDDLNCARRIDGRKLGWFRELIARAMIILQGPPGQNLNHFLGNA